MPRSVLTAPLNPILDQMQADRQFQATFQKDCGNDDTCQSQLEVFPALKLEKDGNFISLIQEFDDFCMLIQFSSSQIFQMMVTI